MILTRPSMKPQLKVRQRFRYFFTTTISGLPAVLLPRLAPDPPGEDLERGLCVGIRTWPYTRNLAHIAGEEPEQRTPLFYRPRRRRSPRPALPRLDARECFGVGAKRSCGRRRGVRQTRQIASRHAYRNSSQGACANPQGMVRSRHEWPPALAGRARRSGIGVRNNRTGLSGLSHRPGRIALLVYSDKISDLTGIQSAAR